MAQLCLWTKIRTKQWLVLDASAFQCMRAGLLCPKCDNFAYLHTRQDQDKLQRCFFFQNRHLLQAHLAKRKRIGYSIGFNSSTNWTLYGVNKGFYSKFVWMVFLFSCWERWWIDDDGTWRTLSATSAIFSFVYPVLGFSRFSLSMRMPVFFHFFQKITNIRSWQWVSSSKIRTQFSHTFFKHITMIFKVMLQYFPALCNHIRSAEG